MDQRKWPVGALIIIAWGLIVSVVGIVRGIMTPAIPDLLSGVIGLVLFYNVFKFTPWARIALIVLLSLNIVSIVILLFVGMPVVHGVIAIALTSSIIYYFSRQKIRQLFTARKDKQISY